MSRDYAQLDLGRPPDLTNLSAGKSARVDRLWSGIAGPGGTAIEVSEISLHEPLTGARMREAWRARRAGSPRPVIVFARVAEGVLLCGPDGSPPPIAQLNVAIAEQILRRVLDHPPVQATLTALSLINRAQGSGSVPGFRNRSLVSTHFVTSVLQTRG